MEDDIIQVDTGRGGADLYGTMGSIPGLVQ